MKQRNTLTSMCLSPNDPLPVLGQPSVSCECGVSVVSKENSGCPQLLSCLRPGRLVSSPFILKMEVSSCADCLFTSSGRFPTSLVCSLPPPLYLSCPCSPCQEARLYCCAPTLFSGFATTRILCVVYLRFCDFFDFTPAEEYNNFLHPKLGIFANDSNN